MKKRPDETAPRHLTSPRDLPSVEALVRDNALDGARTIYGDAFVTHEARAVLEEARKALCQGRDGTAVRMDAEDLPRRVLSRMEALLAGGIRPVINATGTVLHTNLGRSILADEAVCKAALAGSAYTDLEFDVGRGERGERDAFSVSLIKRFTGCEDACVVNNNAAALLITLNTLAEGKEVIISRGELIEIGGSFRLPEIIEKSGCVLREVGTTNRTHAADYIGAINERTALILKVHTSNYTIEGFTSEVGLGELVAIGKDHGIAVVEDLGAGALMDLAAHGLPREPLVSESIRTGAHAVTFSGDKLLGGPQAGLIAGKRETVARIRKNPLKRALRCGKLTLAALEETLKLYLNPGRLAEALPSLGLMTRPIDEIDAMAARAAALINTQRDAGMSASVIDGRSVIGGGSLPGRTLATRVVSMMDSERGAVALQRAFLDADPPVIGRIHRDAFILDPRTILDEEEFLEALRETLEKLASPS